ncbi:MAG: TRIC cation channel family protein [Comamonadaceae bacterium]|nr:TRIC cation channel family protein [Comamonadaceae bacterium]
MPPLIVVVMGTMTGVTGGVLRDILTAQVPLILRREIYATAAVAGVAAYLVLRAFDVPATASVGAGMIVVVALRLLAIRWDVHLPVIRRRWVPGGKRTPVASRGRRDAPRARSRRHHRYGGTTVTILEFMQGYKAAWEARDPAMFAALFHPDGRYHNTPFAGAARRASNCASIGSACKLQEDVQVTFEVLASTPASGIAHWHTTYQVASEELFQVWAKSTGTALPARKPGDPLPRMVLDGVLVGDVQRRPVHGSADLVAQHAHAGLSRGRAIASGVTGMAATCIGRHLATGLE